MNNKRWYDKHKETQMALNLLKSLHPTIQSKLSNDIINVASAIKTVHREKSQAQQPPASPKPKRKC